MTRELAEKYKKKFFGNTLHPYEILEQDPMSIVDSAQREKRPLLQTQDKWHY